jgi:hypothetical protein
VSRRISRIDGPVGPDGRRWVRITPPKRRKSRRTPEGLLLSLMRATSGKGVLRALELDAEARKRPQGGQQGAPPVPAPSARARATVDEFWAYCDEI